MLRRDVLRNSALGLLGLSCPGIAPTTAVLIPDETIQPETIPSYYPNIDPEVVAEVVGKSHFDLEGVKQLVDQRPELAKSVWEWRFGDFESAIGAAAHVGRRDIVLYLTRMGARPTIFTFAMLGAYDTVKAMIDFSPGIQRTAGPHGISLLNHAYAGERMKGDMTAQEVDDLEQTITYLESLGDADGEKYLAVSNEEQQKYLGDYRYGPGEKEGFTIGINMRKLLSLGPIGESGGALYKIADNSFIYNGAPSVVVTFAWEQDTIRSMTISDPAFRVLAEKV